MNPYANYLQSIISPSAYLAQLNALGAAREEAPRPIQPKMRTQEEIVAQLEARYAEIEAEIEKPSRKWPCRTCRWKRDTECTNVLVRGPDFDSMPPNYDDMHRWLSPQYRRAELCGPEKALWEERPSRWRRFIAWLGLDARV